jgi:hypothetical protein
MAGQPVFDIGKPAIELLGAAAVHGRERADHPVAAGRHHKVDTGDEKHRCCDQRQTHSVAKTRQRVGETQNAVSLMMAFVVPRPGLDVLAFGNIGTVEG